MSLRIFFSIIIFTLTEFVLTEKLFEVIILLIPFAISIFYKKKYTIPILLLLCIPINFIFYNKKNLLILLIMLSLDIIIENFPKKLERQRVLYTTSIAFAIVIPFVNQKDFLIILSASQVLIGSFQAIRVYEKKMKRYRTDLGGIYYKAQVLIMIINLTDKNKNLSFEYFNFIFESILFILIIFGVYLRPDLENMKNAKKHGILMRISYVMIIIRNVYMSSLNFF